MYELQEKYTTTNFNIQSCADTVKIMSIERKIRTIMRSTGWNQSQVAEFFGVSQPSVNRWLSGSEPRGDVRDAINDKFQEVVGVMDASEQPDDLYLSVPEFDVHVSAGGGAEVIEEHEIARWPFNPDYVSNFLGLRNAALAIVEVRGDSMVPTLHSGDRVLVNTSDKQISQAGIFVLFDGGGTVIKRVDKRIGNDESVTLISDNRIHESYEVPLDLLNVVGRVVWVARKL